MDDKDKKMTEQEAKEKADALFKKIETLLYENSQMYVALMKIRDLTNDMLGDENE